MLAHAVRSGVPLSLAIAVGAACGGGRDVVGPSHDVVVEDKGTARAVEGYDYVAKRSFSVVALAEARGLAPEVARAAVDRIADSLDTCVTERGRKGELARGAARVVAQIGPGGAVEATSVRVDPGAGAPGGAGALLCLVAPIRLLGFPPADAGARGFAIEALWGR
jgi:hypothetical protein